MMINACEELNCSRLIVTLGKRGCICFGSDLGFCEIPSFAERVVDRLGAGDAFLSLSSLCAVQHAPTPILGLLGNLAAAQAVATVGNKLAVQRDVLVAQIHEIMGT
jgi:sugar/nucleoside kinase (ribokinase family)